MMTDDLRAALVEAKERLTTMPNLADDINYDDIPKHISNCIVIPGLSANGPYFFYMERWLSDLRDGHCGTACCIGGLCEIILKRRLTDGENLVAFDLFYPETSSIDIRAHHAIKAIENFLDTGKPKWKEAMA